VRWNNHLGKPSDNDCLLVILASEHLDMGMTEPSASCCSNLLDVDLAEADTVVV
jgi:hypothetical protein